MLFGLRTAIMATGKQITRYKTAIRISLSRPRSLELGFVTEAEFDPIVDPTSWFVHTSPCLLMGSF
jgi:hypothetical protein